jgi:hypothetical protein
MIGNVPDWLCIPFINELFCHYFVLSHKADIEYLLHTLTSVLKKQCTALNYKQFINKYAICMTVPYLFFTQVLHCCMFQILLSGHQAILRR